MVTKKQLLESGLFEKDSVDLSWKTKLDNIDISINLENSSLYLFLENVNTFDYISIDISHIETIDEIKSLIYLLTGKL